MSGTPHVTGDGPLATALRRALPAQAAVTVLAGSHEPAELDEHHRRAAAGSTAYLPVRQERDAIVIGPWVQPPAAGCHRCVEARARAAHRTRPAAANPGNAPAGAAAGAVNAGAALVGDELQLVGRGHPARTRQALLYVRGGGSVVSRHPFLPDPSCQTCGDLPADGPELATITLRPRPAVTAGSYRVRSLSAERDRLIDTYVDPEVGLITELVRSRRGANVMVTAPFGLPGETDVVEAGYGRTVDCDIAVVTAIAEALERYGGWRLGNRRRTVRASYRQLGPDRALDPESLGLPPPEQFSTRWRRYRPYDLDEVRGWVYGYSFRRAEPILVPETQAFYGPHPSDTRFAFECTNACALGGCLEEAILHAILEAVERDAFLMAWYARLPLSRIDLRTARRRELRVMAERFEIQTGCALYAFDATLLERVPVVILLAVDEQDRPGHPKAFCAAGASLDPERAALSALVELSSQLPGLIDYYREHREQALPMLADPDLVTHLDHHPLLYLLPEAWPRWAFLFARDRVASFAAAFPDRPAGGTDITADLRDLTGRYLAAGLDVAVVDQTLAEHAAADLHCVKAIVPGLLPMTFGHRHRRIHGLPRLSTVPMWLGYRDRPLTPEDVNPHPHPFP